jgi:hypothetical protein
MCRFFRMLSARSAQLDHRSGRERASFLPSHAPLARSPERGGPVPAKAAGLEKRQVQPRRLNDSARFSLILWSRLFNWKVALVIVKPETLIGWHLKGFKLFRKWKSQVGRPRLPENIRKLVRRVPIGPRDQSDEATRGPLRRTGGQARVAAELSVKPEIYVSPRGSLC